MNTLTKNKPTKTLGRLWALLILIFIDSLNYFLVIPVFERLFSKNYPLLAHTLSQHDRDLLFGVAVLLSPLAFVLFSPIVGHLSDRFGRKIILTSCLGASVIGYLLPIIGIAKKALALILLGRFLAGASTSSQPIAQAAVADITTGKQKAMYLALIGFAMTLAMTIGPTLGALLSDTKNEHWLGVSIPYWVGLVLSCLNILLLLVFFKETHKTIQPPKVSLINAMKKPATIHLLLIFFFLEFAWSMYYQILFTYMPKAFDYNIETISFFTAYLGAWMSLGLTVFYRFFLKFLTLTHFAKLSIMLATLGLLLISLINTTWSQWTFVTLIAVFTGTAYASLLACLSNSTDNDHQGLVLGLTSTALGITWAITAFIGNAIVSYHLLLPLYMASASMIITLLLAIKLTTKGNQWKL